MRPHTRTQEPVAGLVCIRITLKNAALLSCHAAEPYTVLFETEAIRWRHGLRMQDEKAITSGCRLCVSNSRQETALLSTGVF